MFVERCRYFVTAGKIPASYTGNCMKNKTCILKIDYVKSSEGQGILFLPLTG